ncbi:cytochrome c [Candidatus Chlorohelix sp.]|uniref:c-type cytochrome n=1 Tax=Candidatus Chlorohelix sp. TaxID=3139201 RepID=UPI00303F9544
MSDEVKENKPRGDAQNGVSPVFFGLVLFGILLVAVSFMLFLTLGDTKETAAPASLAPIALQGKELFMQQGKCGACHAAEGRKAGIGPRLSMLNLGDEATRKIIRNGRGAMPANTELGEDDITKIMVYLNALKLAAAGT